MYLEIDTVQCHCIGSAFVVDVSELTVIRYTVCHYFSRSTVYVGGVCLGLCGVHMKALQPTSNLF